MTKTVPNIDQNANEESMWYIIHNYGKLYVYNEFIIEETYHNWKKAFFHDGQFSFYAPNMTKNVPNIDWNLKYLFVYD